MTKDEALTLEALKYAASKGYGRIVREMKIAPFTIKGDEALAQPAPPPPECKTEAEQTAYAFGWWKALESVRTEPDWKDLFEKQKRRAEMWIAKYEKDIGPLEKAAPIAQEPVVSKWRDAGDLKCLKKGDVLRVLRRGQEYYRAFKFGGLLKECDYAHEGDAPFVWLEVDTATLEKIVYIRKDFTTGAIYADRGDKVDIFAPYAAPQQQEPRNFCPRCGKRTADLTVIHTCTPPEGGHQ